jgi:TonB family protein
MAAIGAPTGSLLRFPGLETANERFKRRCRCWFCCSIILATAIHFTVFTVFPTLTAADLRFSVTEFAAIDLPPEVEIPPPPEQIQRPAIPIVAEAALEEDITIAPTTFEENPVDQLPPPPANKSADLAEQPAFTPYTVAPELKDPARAAEIISTLYPKTLRDAGIGGSVIVWAFIDEYGSVKNCLIHVGSGYERLDSAALEAVTQFSFKPALNYDRHVPVWIQLPISFKVVDG